MDTYETLKLSKKDVFDGKQILTSGDLKTVVKYLRDQGLETNERALKGMSESERYLQQAYAGRYLFELIQNVRDANKQAGIDGSVFIEIANDVISIANTGSPFSKKGVWSITTIGDSTKDSREFIGFKGIGFKSVQEISETPKIITQNGSIQFDRNISWPYLKEKLEDFEEVPLFFIPHFSDTKLSDTEIEQGIVTRIVLPIKENVDRTKLSGGFDQIQLHQLVLLGNLRYLELKKNEERRFYELETNSATGKVTINSNDGTAYFKHFQPSTAIVIPDSVIETLGKKERKLFQKDSNAEISLIFDLNDNNRLQPINHAKLYLYYPLSFDSGFKFLIHSCFIVNPERTELMDVKLNEFLLKEIGVYLAGEWLAAAKKQHRNTFINYLAFKRNEQRPILNHLYNSLIKELADKRFIWDAITGKFYKIDEIVLGDGFDKGLFEDNRLDGKPIVYLDDRTTVDWLKDELKVTYLSYATIKKHIEEECKRQLKKNNFKFFNNLYRYLVEHENLDLRNCNVLLTSGRKLLNSEALVFYGMQKSARPQLPERIAKKIYFSHPEIKISDQRSGKGQTGFREFNMELFVDRLINLYDEDVPKEDILSVLVGLDIKERLFSTIRAKIKLPLANGRWVNPLEAPAYLYHQSLAAVYPESKFIDLSCLHHIGLPPQFINDRLRNFGAWTIPAISFTSKARRINSGDRRFKILQEIRGYNTPYFEILGDWLMDVPEAPDNWFTETVIANWTKYSALVIDDGSPEMEFRSQLSGLQNIDNGRRVNVSGFVHTLRSIPWLCIPTSPIPLSVTDVFGLDQVDYHTVTAFLYKKYLPILQLNFASQQAVIHTLGIKHLDASDIGSWKNILQAIYESHRTLTVDNKEFALFYNKVLNKLFEFAEYKLAERFMLLQLKNTMFLAVNEQSGIYSWQKAQTVFYLDDKPGYDILPAEIKSEVQPQFINRDKNRFGKVAGQIGLSFKQTVGQELIDENYISETTFSVFFPKLPEALALAEQVLNITLQRDLERIKQTRILIKSAVRVRVMKAKQLIRELFVEHKIISGRENLIYTILPPDTGRALFYARLLHDYLTEVLSRDLQILQNLLTDFFGRKEVDSNAFLATYNVDFDRIQEIKDFLDDKVLSEAQVFWRDLLVAKKIAYTVTPFDTEQTNFGLLSELFTAPEHDLKRLEKVINFSNLNQLTNLFPLIELFQLLKIEVSEYNRVTLQKIDFTGEYTRRFSGLKAKYKKTFEQHLYQYLKNSSIDKQADFQDGIDNYLAEFQPKFVAPLLQFDIYAYFRQHLTSSYPDLGLFERKVPLINLQQIFGQHLINFKELLEKSSLEVNLLEEFLNYNKNRSLIYFGQTQTLATRYRGWVKEHTAVTDIMDQPDGLENFVNLPGTVIQPGQTSAVEVSQESDEGSDDQSGSGGGKRPDGGEPSPIKQLIGLVSEKMVFELLKERYPEAEWVSKNAAKAKVNLEGHDRWGFDIQYVDEQDHIHFVEVKGKSNQQHHFYITYPEVKKAHREKEFYHVFFVTQALDNDKRGIQDLGNIFMLNGLEDIFNNPKFTAKFNLLEITFK